MAVLIARMLRLFRRRRTAAEIAEEIRAERIAAVFADVTRIHIAETTPDVTIR